MSHSGPLILGGKKGGVGGDSLHPWPSSRNPKRSTQTPHWKPVVAPNWSVCFQASVQLRPSTSSSAAGARRQTRGSPSGTSAGQQERQKARAHLSSYTRPSVRGFHEAGHANQSEQQRGVEIGKKKIEQNTKKKLTKNRFAHTLYCHARRRVYAQKTDEMVMRTVTHPSSLQGDARARARAAAQTDTGRLFRCSPAAGARTDARQDAIEDFLQSDGTLPLQLYHHFPEKLCEIKSIIVAVMIILSSQSVCCQLRGLQFLPAKLKNAHFFWI